MSKRERDRLPDRISDAARTVCVAVPNVENVKKRVEKTESEKERRIEREAEER